jgi:uncharacterized protein YjdB
MRCFTPLAFLALLVACSESPSAPDRPITAVAITPGTKALIVGETAPLTASVTGGFGKPTVTWTSSNSNIVTVSDTGMLAAKATGTATITATAGGVSGTSNVTVTAGAVDRLSVCDQSNNTTCTSTVTLAAVGTSVVARAYAFNVLNADITLSCTFTWTPNATGVVSISFVGDASRRDAVITRTSAAGNVSITVTCGGRPGIFTILGGVTPPPAP